AGERGPVRDAVLLNAAAALAVYQVADSDPHERLRQTMAQASQAVDTGAAQTTLDRWVTASATR
ncbi:MAG: anthranilate phosphoribosyltransferase, partial [Nocardioides sp.]